MTLIRYSKSLRNMKLFQKEFYFYNDAVFIRILDIARKLSYQPIRTNCINCGYVILDRPKYFFENAQSYFRVCGCCGHLNSYNQNTQNFSDWLYSGSEYVQHYGDMPLERYEEIYLPKAKFLRDTLEYVGVKPGRLDDYGAGMGLFMSAARSVGFLAKGYECNPFYPEREDDFFVIPPDELVDTIKETDATVVSFIGSLEHFVDPRSVLRAVRDNKNIEFMFLSVPMFSATAVFQEAFEGIAPRHLSGGHTHLYTETSLQYVLNEFEFDRVSEWWFGLDMLDLSRSISYSLPENLRPMFEAKFGMLVDELQAVFDSHKMCSEVHMVVKKRGANGK